MAFMRIAVQIRLLIISVFVGMTACVQLPSNASQPDMPNFTSDNFVEFYKNEVDRRTFSEVMKPVRQTALGLLAKSNIIEIDTASARSLLAGNKLQIDGDVKYYLARVRRCTDSGLVNAYLKGSILFVSHDDLGYSECREIFDSALIIASRINLTGAIASSSVTR